MSGPVDVLARAVERLRVPHPDHAQDASNNAAAIALHEYSAAVSGLIDKARGLADAVEFRIDDPRAALLDELRAAITAAGGTA